MWRNDEDARGDTPCPPHPHNRLCPTMSPSPRIPPLARDRGSRDRCSYPCLSLSPSRETGEAQAAVPTPCTQLIFFMFFFYVFPLFLLSPCPISLLPPSPLLSLAFLSAFLQGKPALPPPRGGHQDGDPPQVGGTSFPQSEDPLSLGTSLPKMGTPCLDGDLHRLRTPLPGWEQAPQIGDPL